jgi:hypothetical protein
MNRLPFVLWLIGFHFVMRVGDYVDFKFGMVDRVHPGIQGIYYLIVWGIWIGVAILLWRDSNLSKPAKGADEDGGVNNV